MLGLQLQFNTAPKVFNVGLMCCCSRGAVATTPAQAGSKEHGSIAPKCTGRA